MNLKRVTVFCGHYGSGKTNIAVNYALHLRSLGLAVSIADIDIVNPYFRSKDSAQKLEQNGVEVISLPFANSNVDLPSIPSQVYSLVQNKSRYAVFDVGGDDMGSCALGRFVPYIMEENNYNMVYVVNFFRPLTQDAESAFENIKEIENACGIPFTGIINNSNIGRETKAEDVKSTFNKADLLSRLSKIPVVGVTCRNDIALEGATKIELQVHEFD